MSKTWIVFLNLFLVAFTNATNDNIVQLAAKTKDLSTLVTAVKDAELVKTLEGPGPFTVFAPTNEAFAMLPKVLIKYLLDPTNRSTLVKILTYHVVSGSVHAGDLKNKEVIKTLSGSSVLATVKGSNIFINYARVTTPNVDASNGVVHIIDKVLIPPPVLLEIKKKATAFMSSVLENAEDKKHERMCCRALTLPCLSCAANQTIGEYCDSCLAKKNEHFCHKLCLALKKDDDDHPKNHHHGHHPKKHHHGHHPKKHHHGHHPKKHHHPETQVLMHQ